MEARRRRFEVIRVSSNSIRASLCAAILAIGLVLTPSTDANAAAKTAPAFDDRALLVDQTARYLVIPPGKAVTVWFDFKNTGTSAWTNQDPHPVSLNTDNPMNRKSKFYVPKWKATWRPARLMQKTVQPGETGRFKFVLKSPKKQPGVWRESFALVRDKNTRIPGGRVEFIIVVGQTPDLSVIYHAKPVTPALSFWVKPGERIYQPVYYKNDGRASWRNEGWGTTTFNHVASENVLAAASRGIAASEPLPGAVTAYTKRDEKATVFLDYTAPTDPGTYLETYNLIGPYGPVAGSAMTVLVTVSSEPKPPLDAEPIVRVGIYAPVRPVVVTANGAFEARNATTGELIGSLAADEQTTTTYDAAKGSYSVTLPTGPVAVTAPVRFVPLSADTVMEVKSYNNIRNTTIDGIATKVNDNKFRGTVEVNYATATSKLWVINELPIEQYLKGLGETGSKSPVEFAKALITAARTYAMFHTFYQAKHRSENYYVNSTTDQIYRGYNYEIQTPNITQAVTESRGMTITHPSMVDEKNKVGAIVAAYSSCTDGRTRSYEERWGGPPGQYPFLLSVPDPNGICTNPTWLAGGGGNHMVGMSASGALNTIVQQGLQYDAILKYYYTDVSVTKAYL